MRFNFTPMTEEALDSLNIIEPGVYNFTVIKAKTKTSKSGNPMMELQLKVWDKLGVEHTIFDYLLSTSRWMYKTKHFCDVAGLEDKYNTGSFTEMDCEGKSGKVDIIVQKGQPKEDGGFYPSKNAVRDYVTANQAANSHGATQKPVAEEMNDDIPF